MSEDMNKLCVECAEHVLEGWQEDFEAWHERAPDRCTDPRYTPSII